MNQRRTSSKNNPLSAGARQVAVRCLMRWAEGGVFAETLIANYAASLSAADRALTQAIVLGTLRHLRFLEHICNSLRDGKLEENARWAILAGLCQIFVIRLAEHAAVSETVNTVPKRIKGLVNAILRQALRRKQEIETSYQELPLGVRYSMPDWLVERWLREFGPEETEQMLAWNQAPPPVYARLNPLKPMPVPADWEPHDGAEGWYKVPCGLPMEALREGRVYVADPSTRYSIELLAPRCGERILDACAAPGGKSAAIIAATRGDVQLWATDAAPHRLKQLQQNLMRAGGQGVEVACHDWTQVCPPAWREHFDAVLLDVPCSNSGVLQRRVDARWRLEPAEFSRLSVLQSTILDNACAAVRCGGRLVYSTCSIDSQEDREVVQAFIQRHPEFVLERDYLALPHREQADGAYAALLLKKDSGSAC